MDRLIADFVDASRIRAGTFDVRREQVHVPRLISDVLESFEGQAAARKVRLVAAAHGVPELLVGDAQRLVQALSNRTVVTSTSKALPGEEPRSVCRLPCPGTGAAAQANS